MTADAASAPNTTASLASDPGSLPAVLTRTWAKHDVLRTLDELRDTWRDYAELLNTGLESVQLTEEKQALIEFHRGLMGQGRPPHEKMREMVGLLGDLLERIKPETLVFHVPSRSALLPEERSRELTLLSQRLHQLSEPLEALTDTLLPATRLADMVTAPSGVRDSAQNALGAAQRAGEDAERTASVKAAAASLFKGVVRQDWADVSLVMRHIHLVTTTSRSQGVIQEVARIAREIYDSLNEFSDDLSGGGLSQATHDIPDAVVKLNGVIGQLEEFAHASLDSLERLTADALDDEERIGEGLAALAACDTELAALAQADAACADEALQLRAALTDEVQKPLDTLRAHRQLARDAYLALIANMGFQDLTGQTLKRVIGFIEDLQDRLMRLIAKHGVPEKGQGEKSHAQPVQTQEGVPLTGPDAPTGRSPLSQENVDKILADLGF